jgi:sec-independent protein translocase protein TatA
MSAAFLGPLGGPELIIILAIVLLLFGATRLPKLARSLGEASKEFKQGLAEGAAHDDEAATRDPAKETARESAKDGKDA